MVHNSTIQALEDPLRRQDRAYRTIASLQVFNNNLLLDTGVSLALSSSCSYLILVLATISSAQRFKTVIVLLLEVFKGSIAALPATIFLSIVVRVLGNSCYGRFKYNIITTWGRVAGSQLVDISTVQDGSGGTI